MSIESPSLKDAIAAFGEKPARLSMAKAMNQTAKKSVIVLAKSVEDVYNVKASAIKKIVVLKKAKPATLEGELFATSRKIPIIGFKGTRQNKKGLRVEVLRGKPYTMSSRFVTRVGNASRHRGAFERYGPKRLMTSGTYAGQMRQPIRELFGPSLSQMIDHTEVLGDLVEFYEAELPPVWAEALRQRIQFMIHKRGIG